MRLDLHLTAATLVVVILMTGAGQTAAAAPSRTVVFEGTITSIRTIDHELTPWLVTLAVRKVISGEFSGSTFQFAVHSPARAGLKEGGAYTIEAVWKKGGYTVDETQWRRPKRLRIGLLSTEPANRRCGGGSPFLASLGRAVAAERQDVGQTGHAHFSRT